MTALVDIIQKISDTQAAMRKLEAAMAEHPSRLSLQATYESLQRRHENLEAKFLVVADLNYLDVCTYRVTSEGDGGYPISALGNVLVTLQKWFSTVYDALKTGPKKRARLSAEIASESSLDFAFSYPGSIGVAMTIPSERLLFENDLQLAMMKTTEMLKAESSEQIQIFAQDLGIASIRAMYTWVQGHVNSGLGANIQWIRKEKSISEINLGFNELRNIKQAIEATSEKEETTFEITGWLVGADTSNHTFHMVFDGDIEEMRGKMSETIGDSYTVELPQRYKTTITKVSFVSYATEEEKISYFLKSLEKI